MYQMQIYALHLCPSFPTDLRASCATQVSNYAISVGLEGDEQSNFTDEQYEALEDLITQLKENQSNPCHSEPKHTHTHK